MKKRPHFELCTDPNCARKWCVDRRNSKCFDVGHVGCELAEKGKSDRCIYCHTKYICSGYGWCELHGDHGP